MSTGEGGLAAAILLDVWQWTPFVFLMALAALGFHTCLRRRNAGRLQSLAGLASRWIASGVAGPDRRNPVEADRGTCIVRLAVRTHQRRTGYEHAAFQRDVFRDIGRNIGDAAKVNGANTWQIFWLIGFPA